MASQNPKKTGFNLHNLQRKILSISIFLLLSLSLTGCAKIIYSEGGPSEPIVETQTPIANETTPAVADRTDSESAQQPIKTQPQIFSMKVYYGDERGNLMSEVFAGDQEVGKYYLWIKNIGTYNASCTVTSHDEDVSTKTITSKEKYKVFLRPGQNDSRLYTFNGFKTAITELPDTVECIGAGTTKVQNEKPIINQYYWRRYYVESGDLENPNDLAKKIDVGGNISIIQKGFIYDFYVIENVQNGNCTIRYQEGKYELTPAKTRMISNVKVTLMESRFKYCAILFW